MRPHTAAPTTLDVILPVVCFPPFLPVFRGALYLSCPGASILPPHTTPSLCVEDSQLIRSQTHTHTQLWRNLLKLAADMMAKDGGRGAMTLLLGTLFLVGGLALS